MALSDHPRLMKMSHLNISGRLADSYQFRRRPRWPLSRVVAVTVAVTVAVGKRQGASRSFYAASNDGTCMLGRAFRSGNREP
jgi:hypothetical protein